MFHLLRPCLIFFACLAVGEGVVALTGTKLPACVIGMLLLTLLLRLGWVKLPWVKAASDLLMDNLGLFFVPAGVALLCHFHLIKTQFWPIALATVLSTVLVLAVTGHVHQLFRRKGGRS